MDASITSLLDQLPSSPDKLSSLQDLKTILVSVHPSSLRNIVPNISFHVLFDFLVTDDSEQLELCCDVLDRLLSATGPSLVLHNFVDELLKGLSHKSSSVQCLCLKQLQTAQDEVLDELLIHNTIVDRIVELLADQSLEVAKYASIFITGLGKSSQGLGVLYSNHINHRLEQVLNISDVIRFRVYEMLINISKLSITALEYTHNSGLMQQLLNEVHKDDVLVQLNAVELLSDLTLVDHGLVYLDQQGIVTCLENMMKNVETDPLAGLLLPGLIKFFGGVAKFHPKEVCSDNQTFINMVFGNLTSGDQTLRSIAVQTVGFIGSSIEGKLALEKLGNAMNLGMQAIGSIIRESQSELRINGFQSISHIIRLEVPDQTDELGALTEKWFSYLGSKPFDTIMSIARQPFEDLRCCSHGVLRSLALQRWGQKLMNGFPGFIEYLLDRSTEKVKEAKESKFEIVKTLAESPTIMDVFGQQTFVDIKAFYLQGPFHVQTQSEVAFEGE